VPYFLSPRWLQGLQLFARQVSVFSEVEIVPILGAPYHFGISIRLLSMEWEYDSSSR